MLSFGYVARRGVVHLAILSAFVACKRKVEPPVRETETSTENVSGDGSAPPAPEPPGPPPRCQAPPSSSSFLIGSRGVAMEAEEKGVDQPFAVELGGAVSTTSGFGVAALRQDGGRTMALVALTDPDASRGTLLDLGRVHGAAEPPRLVAHGDEVFGAVVDSDASGPTLRLMRFHVAKPQETLVWGAEVQQGRDDSSAFSLALTSSGAGGLLVWDDYDRKLGRSVVRGLRFHTEAWEKREGVRLVTPKDMDAEAPLVVARDDGYWIAWLSQDEASRGRDSGAGEEGEVGQALVDAPPTRLWIAPFNGDGERAAEPLAVSPPSSQAGAFDLIAAEGGAWLAWRDESRAPGVQGAALHLAWVGMDGTVTEHHIESEGLEAGVAVLLQDGPLGGGPLWLAATRADGSSHLGRVTRAGVEDFRAEPALGAKQALTTGHGRILFAQPKGPDLQLGTVRCASAGPAKSPARAPQATGTEEN